MSHIVERFYTACAQKNVALMLDLDGATVLRKVAVHNPVEPDSAYDESLRTLAANGCPVAINTGRPKIFVHNLFPFLTTIPDLPVWIATETGARISGPNGEGLFQKIIPNISGLRKQFGEAAGDIPGVIIEGHKDCSITINMKNCPDHLRGKTYSHMLTIAHREAEANPDINIIGITKPNDTYIEVVPAGINKASAVDHIMQDMRFNGKDTFAFGDSAADVPMLAAVRDRNGCGIWVGSSDVGKEVTDLNLIDHHESQAILRVGADLASEKISLQNALRDMPQYRRA